MKDVEEDALARYLKELHLPAFRNSYEELARQAQQEGFSFEQYLLGLAQRECQERRHNRVERLLNESRLPLEKGWAALDLKRLPAKAVQQARTAEGEFLDRRRTCWCLARRARGRRTCLCGSSGTGPSGRRMLFTQVRPAGAGVVGWPSAI